MEVLGSDEGFDALQKTLGVECVTVVSSLRWLLFNLDDMPDPKYIERLLKELLSKSLRSASKEGEDVTS